MNFEEYLKEKHPEHYKLLSEEAKKSGQNVTQWFRENLESIVHSQELSGKVSSYKKLFPELMTESETDELIFRFVEDCRSDKNLSEILAGIDSIKNMMAGAEEQKAFQMILAKLRENQLLREYSTEQMHYVLERLNLGVFERTGQPISHQNLAWLPALTPDMKMAAELTKRMMIKELQKARTPDSALQKVQDLELILSSTLSLNASSTVSNSSSNFSSNVPHDSADSGNTNSSVLMSGVFSEIHEIIDYWNDLRARARIIKPTFGQAVRAHYLTQGVKSALLNDATSAGKTFAVYTTQGLQEEILGRNTKVLLLAPEQAIKTAWTQEELDQYSDNMNLRKRKIVYLKDLKNWEQALEYDIIAVNYFELGIKKAEDLESNRFFRFLRDKAKDFDAVIIDEAHNLKTPRINRTDAFTIIRNLTREDCPYFLLTATPYASGLQDLGMMFHLIDPENYPAEKYDYNSQPNVIRDLKASGRWFSISRDEIGELFQLGPLSIRPLYVEMPEVNVQRYFEIWNEIVKGKKFLHKTHAMRLELLDAKISGTPSLIELVENSLSQGKAVAVYSYYRTKVMDRLMSLFSRHKPDYIDGTVAFDDRVKIGKKFQEGDCDLLFSTIKSAGEAIPLHTRTRPTHVIALDSFLTPWHREQVIGRFYRYGQTAPVEVDILLAQSSILESMMISRVQELKRQGIFFRPGWNPWTIDTSCYQNCEGLLEIIDDKVNRRGETLNDIELLMAELSRKPRQSHIPIPEKRPREFFMRSMFNQSMLYGAGCEVYSSSLGERVNPEHLDDNVSEIAKSNLMNIFIPGRIKNYEEILVDIKTLELQNDPNPGLVTTTQSLVDGYDPQYWKKHPEAWSTLPPMTSNLMISRIIKKLESEIGQIPVIVDAACGPACLSAALKRPIINLDINLSMLKKGKQYLEELVDQGQITGIGHMIRGNYQCLPFADSSINFFNLSYGLQFSCQDEKDNSRREVESTLLEINRVLSEEKGFAAFNLPASLTTPAEFITFKQAIEDYGFSLVIADKVKAYNTGNQRVFETYFILAELKNKKNLLSSRPITMWPTVRFRYSSTGGSVRKIFHPLSVLKDRQTADFYCKGRNIEGIIGDYLK